MKKITLLTLLLLGAIFNINNAQVLNWYETNGPRGIEKTKGFTSDSSGNIYMITDRFIYKSTDTAHSWQRLKLFDQILSSIAVNENNAIIIRTNSDTTYISADYGLNWNLTTEYFDIKSDSKNGLYKVEDNQILYSTDSGLSWEDITPSLPSQSKINSLYILKDDVILISAAYIGPNFARSGGIFFSKDYGKTWGVFFQGSACSILHVTSTEQIYAEVKDIFYSKLYFLPDLTSSWEKLFENYYSTAEVMTNKNRVFIYLPSFGYSFETKLIYSDDSHKTWKTIVQYGTSVKFKFFVISDIILIGYDYKNGIYKTTDFGSTWTINKNDFIGLTSNFLFKNGNVIYSATTYGLHKTEDYGDHWKFIGLENINLHCATISNEGELYIGAWEIAGGIYKSINDTTFIQLSNGLPTDHKLDILSLKTIGPNNILAAGKWGNSTYLFFSTDKGSFWETLPNSSSSNQIIVDKSSRVYCLDGGDIIYSDDYGFSWEKTNFDTQRDRPVSLAINSKDEIFAGTFHGIYKSSDRGLTWNKIYEPNAIIEIDYIFIDSKNNIYFITKTSLSGSLYQYIYDNGPKWKNLNSEFNSLGVSSIVEDSQGHLLVGTFNGGVYRSYEKVTTSVEEKNRIPTTYKLFQNYPNPFNPTTNIEIQIPTTSLVTLEVYDVLGRKISTLLNQEKTAGIYNVVFDASNLSSGVYFYTLWTKEFIQTKKMILIR